MTISLSGQPEPAPAPDADSSGPPAEFRSLFWWLNVLQVRLRLVLIMVIAGVVVSQWTLLSRMWERWILRPAGLVTSTQISAGHEYFCPMDPGVLSAWPAICPICNMDLVPRRKTDPPILPEGVVARMQLSPYRVQLAGVRVTPVRVSGSTSEARDDAEADSPLVLAIPATAVIDHGEQKLVYVEEMAGMFDAVPVQLGPLEEGWYTVVSGVHAGQSVVTAGAFLIDAEARLNPALATGYFGASQPALSSNSSTAPVVTQPTARPAGEILSEEDRALVEKQKICPVTGLSLESMGGPIPVMVGTQRVFICCAGCRKALLAEPEKYLARLAAATASGAP